MLYLDHSVNVCFSCGYEPGTLVSTAGGYHLRLHDEIVVDLEAAVEALGAAESALDSGQASAAIELAGRAQVLLDGSLLPASAGAWVEARRYQARTQLIHALEVQAEAWLALAKPAASVAAAQRAVELDAFRESAHRLMIRAHASAGNKAEALACYERCRRLLSDELGVDPAPESEAVYLQVLRDEIPPAIGPASAPPALSSDAIEQNQSPQELERVGEAALWSGDHQHSISARQKAYRAYLEAGDRRSAARVALALASNHGIRSELAEAEGWYRSAARLLEAEPEAPEHGFLAAVGAIVLFEVGELPACHQQARRSLELGERFGIPDLQALGITFQGLSLARQDRPAEAFPMLDEAMTLALAGRVTPFTAGVVFCRTIRTSLDLFDFRRAAEWIGAILRSATDTGFASYPGDCSAHLAAALEARGSWSEAERQADKACQACERFELSHVGLASYTIGEIQLRRGEFARADEAFQRATDYGISPQPGLALLQRARGDVAGALASVRTWLDSTSIRLVRARVLPAAVEIGLAAGDPEFARRAAGELASIADVYGTIALRAAATCARGWLALACGESSDALRDLRDAAALFREAEMPYQVAVARRRLAEALLAQGDRVGAGAELAAAARLFDRLGAAPDARHAGQWLAQLERSTTPSV